MDNFLLASLVLFVSATLAAVASRWLNLPPVLGYIAAGIVLGSSVTGLIEGGGNLELLAEIGVMLLLFTVGLEFSLTEFWADRRRVLSAGALEAIRHELRIHHQKWQPHLYADYEFHRGD